MVLVKVQSFSSVPFQPLISDAAAAAHRGAVLPVEVQPRGCGCCWRGRARPTVSR